MYANIIKKKLEYITPSHQYLKKLTFNSKTRIFKSITTKRNKTEIAPTYTIRIKIAKNSTPREIVRHELKKKIKTKANIECTGLFVKSVYNPTASNKQKKTQKNKSIKPSLY